jgi:DMSO/TMAO reductase YedYZ molybdopterin-dependent catalytic subunit
MVEPLSPRAPKQVRPKLEPHQQERVPGGQFLTQKFPVLTYGPSPKVDLKEFTFRIWGQVSKEVELNWEQFMALPKTVLTADFHCVTQWSRLDNTWEGVALPELAKLAGPLPEAKAAMIYCYGGYTTNLLLQDAMREDVIFAYKHDGKDLERDHGGPLRLIVPHLYGWKSAKWASGIEFMRQDRPGFWEQHGYHMRGDPWKEERFWDELM